jgi:quercetin dioxygenase-like cupin family protein
MRLYLALFGVCVAGACKQDKQRELATSEDRSPATAPAAPSGQADVVLGAPIVHPLEKAQWQPAPEAFPKGAQIALLEGSPPFPEGKTFTFMLRFPAGYTVPPHTHPTAERVTVLTGRMRVGHGPKLDPSRVEPVVHADLFSMPAGHPHFVTTDAETIVALSGVGPVEIYYVNPKDDPRATPPKAHVVDLPVQAPLQASVVHADGVKFAAVPLRLRGLQVANLEGTPSEPKTFMMRVKLPAGVRIAPTSHDVTARFTVLAGQLELGMGGTWSEPALMRLAPGAIAIIPKQTPYFMRTTGETVVQIFGVGPFELSWDDATERASG